MNYKQLAREQRYQIYALKKAGQNQSQIALVVGCHKSTISRELQRNCGQRGYYPLLADKAAHKRHREAYHPRITTETGNKSNCFWASSGALSKSRGG
jgi:IS30 family transposase